jgi:hypothetical protein
MPNPLFLPKKASQKKAMCVEKSHLRWKSVRCFIKQRAVRKSVP